MKKTVLTLISATLILCIACTQKQQPFSLLEEEGGISGAYEALNFLGNQRMYPYEKIPADGYAKAFETIQKNFKNPEYKASDDEWKSLGPHNIGGRTLAIAVNPQNPNTIFAGSASGGLWRSFTQGRGAEAWHKMDINFPVLGVSSIAISPTDTTVMYIGTGEVYNYKKSGTSGADRATRGSYGIGVLKTSDGGITWEKSLDWSYNSERGVQVVKLDPSNENIIWAGTTEGTYKSTDAGATWTQVSSVKMVMDLAINSANPDIVILGCGNFASEGYGIYRTSDGGETWVKITQNLPTYYEGKTMVDFSLANPDIVYASIGNGFSEENGASWLYRSNDAGQNWSLTTNIDYSKWQGWFSHDVAAHPTNPNEAMVVGIDIWKLNGPSFSQISQGGVQLGTPPIDGPDGPPNFSHSDHHAIVYDPTNSNRIYFANDGGIYVSENGGTTFESRNGAYQTTQFYNGNANAPYDSLLFMGGLQDNSTALYSGSLAWRKMLGGDGSNSAFDPENENNYYIGYQNLGLTISLDQGYDFFYFLDVPGEDILPTAFIAPYKLGNQNPDILYAGRSVVYKSTNGGFDWTATNSGQELDGNPALSMAVSRQSDEVVYVATAPYFTKHGVFVTENGGDTWSDISSNILPDRYPMDMAIDPQNEAIAYVVYSGFGTDHVFRTKDYGETWTAIDNGLPDIPTSAVIVDEFNSNIIYIGNDIGVFASQDDGASWQILEGGIPSNVMVMDLSISILNKKLRVGTHGNGVYERPLLDDEIDNEIAQLSLKVFLEGAYDYNTQTMRTRLVEQDLLPLSQPYNVPPWNYNGTETVSDMPLDVVDWVLVEMRTGTPSETGTTTTNLIETKAGLLLSNGQVVSTNNSLLSFDNLTQGVPYHIVVRHRNHLDIISSLTVAASGSMTYDFTTATNLAFGPLQQKDNPDGTAALFVGDYITDGIIQNSDSDAWLINPADLYTYDVIDGNLDGVVQITDHDAWFFNRAKIGVAEVRY